MSDQRVKQSKSLPITIVVCITLILAFAVGAWIFNNSQNLKQQKQLAEYEQQQLNSRNKADNFQKCIEAAHKSSVSFAGLACEK
jgi:uncharacterized protein HemX